MPYVAVLLLLSGFAAGGWWFVSRHGCTGAAHATVDASPDIAPILTALADDWAKTRPSSGGTCVSVTVEAKDSSLMATALGSDWDPAVNGPAPDVWVPASSVWVRQASASTVVSRMIPDRQPSLARTPTVVAVPRDMAGALGADAQRAFDWPDLISDSRANGFWSRHGHANWGQFTFTMTDPKTSTAGLLALMSVADEDNNGNVDQSEQPAVLALKQTMHRYLTDTTDVFAGLDKADKSSAAAAITYTSAFPVLEQNVISYNRTNPKEPLVSLYPASGSYDADYPYLVLENPPWSTGPNADVAAAAFLRYARGPAGRAAFLGAGFRDPNRAGGAMVNTANGAEPTVDPLPRAILVPDSVEETLTDWTAVTRGTNLLLVLDISGSMKEKVAGATTRLTLAKAAAIAAVGKYDGQANLGLWVFSSALSGTIDYREVVPLGPLGDTMPDGRTRQAEMIAKIGKLTAGGSTGLYDTVAAAQREVASHFVANATNLVVLLTDGNNDDPTGGSDLPALLTTLSRNHTSSTPVPVVTIGIGEGADFTTLQQISRASGTVSLSARGEIDIDQVLLAGMFGSLPGNEG